MAVDVVAALVVEDGKFMICQRPAHKARGLLWEFVGGKVEPGETRAEALVRECREELGVAVAPGPIYMEVDHVAAPEAGARGHPLHRPVRHPPLRLLPRRRDHPEADHGQRHRIN